MFFNQLFSVFSDAGYKNFASSGQLCTKECGKSNNTGADYNDAFAFYISKEICRMYTAGKRLGNCRMLLAYSVGNFKKLSGVHNNIIGKSPVVAYAKESQTAAYVVSAAFAGLAFAAGKTAVSRYLISYIIAGNSIAKLNNFS